MAQTFAEAIEKERARLNGIRDEALARRAKIDDELAAVNMELGRIAAYENYSVPKATTKRSSQGERSGSHQDGILTLLKSKPEGLAPKDIADELGLQDRKQSVSNALAALKRAGKITKADGKYTVVT